MENMKKSQMGFGGGKKISGGWRMGEGRKGEKNHCLASQGTPAPFVIEVVKERCNGLGNKLMSQVFGW